MCLSPKEIVNPSKYLLPESGQQLYITIPCGHCSECIVQYRNEWRNRAYYECLDCYSHDGFVLFDTLTYKDSCLPHLSDFVDIPEELDFPCFSKQDLQHFFKRLRRDLELDGFDVASNLRYFVVCEYGSKLTRRPHYHLLFFCSVPELSNRALSQYISNAWCYFDIDGNRKSLGLTDGIPYKPYSHVDYNTFYKGDERKILGYVSKYCTKDFSYCDLVEKRLKSLTDVISMYDNDLMNDIKSYVSPFHLQSSGFGWNALLRFYPLSYIMHYKTIPVIDKNGVVRHVALSQSLKRKLFYEYKRENNRVRWIVKDDFKVFLNDSIYRNITLLRNRIFPIIRDYERSTKLAEYILFMRNRLMSSLKTPSEIIASQFNVSSGAKNYCCHDRKFLNKSVFTALDFGDTVDGFVSDVTLQQVFDYCNLHDLSFIDLRDFAKYCYCSPLERDYQLYKSKLDLMSDGQLGLLKLIHRMNFIHKS